MTKMVKMTKIKVDLILIWNSYSFIGFEMNFSLSYKQKYLRDIGVFIKLNYFESIEKVKLFLLQ